MVYKQVTLTDGMFYNAAAFNQPIEEWKVDLNA